jgi:outer membrane protein OmpA-like peptidoglycan-associated protein
VALLILTAAAATAQVIRSSHSLYGRLGVGTSVSETDAATYAVEPYSLTGELGYQFSHPLGLGMGVTWADYPKANFRNTTMATFYSVLRWTMFPHQTFTPYMQAGPHVTTGGDNPAGGGFFGLGIDYVLSRRSTLFAEATAYGTFPDDAIDSRDDGRATFDGLGFWGVGIRANLRPAPTPPTIESVEGPLQVFRDSTATFTVRVDASTSLPVRYTWTLGDGTPATGLVVDHAYLLEGEYALTVTASNAAGTDTYVHDVRVHEPSVPARVLALQADTTVVRTGQSVRLNAEVEGTAPLSLTWDFGDYSLPVAEKNVHRYRDGRFIGTLQQRVTQGYAFDTPGFYTVTLAANNDFGLDERAVLLEVVAGGYGPPVADACRNTPAPDTLLFDFDKATLRAETVDQLNAHVARLLACPSTQVHLAGRADYVGTSEYNLTLSERRAQSVRRFYEQAGITADRIVHQGLGEVNDPCPPRARDQGCQTHRHVQSVFLAPDRVPRAERPSATAPSPWGLVVGSFQNANAAERVAQRMRHDLPTEYPISVMPSTSGPYYRVVIGTFASLHEARMAKASWGEALPPDAWFLKVSVDDFDIARITRR